VGDCVLSRDVDTGRLDLKPVLRATQRTVTWLVRLETAGRPITLAGGHWLWLNGDGWTKARLARSGRQLHGFSGPVQVSCVAPAPRLATYNLVVADYHTYFVGRDGVLIHDETIPRATDALAPGLTRE